MKSSSENKTHATYVFTTRTRRLGLYYKVYTYIMHEFSIKFIFPLHLLCIFCVLINNIYIKVPTSQHISTACILYLYTSRSIIMVAVGVDVIIIIILSEENVYIIMMYIILYYIVAYFYLFIYYYTRAPYDVYLYLQACSVVCYVRT